MEAIARDPVLAARVQPCVERFGASLRELEGAVGLTDLRNPWVVKRIKEIMEYSGPFLQDSFLA